MTEENKETKRLIKKYANRRLYDTKTSSYITLNDVKALVLENEDLKIIDAKTNDDLTRNVLLQIILEEEESGGVPMFSSEILAQIIRFYGSTMQGLMGDYLEKNIAAFVEIQKNITNQSHDTYNPQLGPDDWAKFMAGQIPVMQDAMNTYIEQSKSLFMQMQDQMQGKPSNTNIFNLFPFTSPFTKEES